MAMADRLEKLAKDLVEREQAHATGLAHARSLAAELHDLVAQALERFHAITRGVAPQLGIELGPVRPDDKHLHAVEFDLRRGRHRAVVTVKSRGEVTLVGPFHAGKTEAPCASFPSEERREIEAALSEFLVDFIEQAAAP